MVETLRLQRPERGTIGTTVSHRDSAMSIHDILGAIQNSFLEKTRDGLQIQGRHWLAPLCA